MADYDYITRTNTSMDEVNHFTIIQRTENVHEMRSLLESEAPCTSIADDDNDETRVTKKPNCCSSYLGLIMAVLSSLCFSLCSLIVKVMGDVDPLELSAVRFIGILLPTISVVIYTQENPLGPREKRGFLILRAICGAMSLMTQFYAIRHMPLADASVVIFSAPVFVAIFARIFLNEQCTMFNIIMIVLTILGVLFITKPPFLFGDSVYDRGYTSETVRGAFVALIGTIFNANVYILLRHLKGIHYSVIMLTFSTIAIVLSSISTVVFGHVCWPPCGMERVLIILIAVFSFGGQVLLTKSLQLEQAGSVAIYRTADIVFAFIWQIIFFNEVPNIYSISGAVLVSTSVILTGVRKWLFLLPDNKKANRLRITVLGKKMGSLINLGQNVPMHMGPDHENVRIGKIRPSMKKNELLQKLEVEKPKNRCRDLPGYGYVYGVASNRKGGGVADALNGWNSNSTKPLKCHDPSHKVKSFIDMNRSCAILGLATAHDQELFRKKHPMQMLSHPLVKGPRKSSRKASFEVTFGRPNVRHAPMFEILQNKFQNDFIAEKLLQNARETNLFLPKHMTVGNIRDDGGSESGTGSGNGARSADINQNEPASQEYGQCAWCRSPIFEEHLADKVDCTNGCGREFHKECVLTLNPDFDPDTWICPKCTKDLVNCLVCAEKILKSHSVRHCSSCNVAAHETCTAENLEIDGTWLCPECTDKRDMAALFEKLSVLEVAAETVPAAIFTFRTEYERKLAVNRRAARLEAERMARNEKERNSKLKKHLTKSIPHRCKVQDIRRRSFPPKVYSVYSCVPSFEGGEISLKKVGSGSYVKLSDADIARIERNRQRALLLRQSRLAAHPYARDSEIKKSCEPKLIDTNGGFFLEPEKEESLKNQSKPIIDRPFLDGDTIHCNECEKPFMDSFLLSKFHEPICDNCRDGEDKHCLITKTEAKNTYLLKDCDLEKREPPLMCIKKKNPRQSNWGEMHLYLKSQVVKRAMEVWETEEKLEEEHEKRCVTRIRNKQNKFNKKVKELRRAVRSSLWKKDNKEHVHEYGAEEYSEDDDLYTKTCSIGYASFNMSLNKTSNSPDMQLQTIIRCQTTRPLLMILARETGPGPAAHNLPRTIGCHRRIDGKCNAPAYSIAGRTKFTFENYGPGPGAYHMPSGVTRRGLNIGHEYSLGPKLPPPKDYSPVPAPIYYPKAIPNKKKSHILQKIDPFSCYPTPAPNAYILPNPRSDNAIHLKGREKFASYLRESETPGPVALPEMDLWKKNSPQFIIGVRTKFIMNSLPKDRIKLNVGGTVFETTRSTVEKLGSDYFSRLLDPNSSFSQPTDGIFFIDRDPECFRVILNIARYGEVFLNDGHVTLELLEREAEFYLLSDCCRTIISRYKNEIPKRHITSVTMNTGGSGLCVCLELSPEDFNSSRADFLYHHACLKKERQYLFAGGMGYDLVCSVNSACSETLVRPREPLMCSRCLREIDVSTPRMCSFVALQLTKMFQISVEIRGEEHLKDEAAIVVCNHQSSIDVTCMMAVWPKMPRCAPIIKKELLYAGPFGICAWLCGAVFVDRSNSARAQKSLNCALNYLTERKIKLWFFPEGTRNDSGTMLPFKKGAFHLAIQSQRPILPMTFSSYANFYNKRIHKFDNGGKVIIQILPPIPTEGLTVDDMSTLMANVRSQMEASIASTTKEIEAALEAKKSK
uniref:1-acyl-sn-glycerol-3-phosphate acyltransferase n=1 Tax=Strigamia maritima TaxID=126957 RepID=T1J654_STRMM